MKRFFFIFYIIILFPFNFFAQRLSSTDNIIYLNCGVGTGWNVANSVSVDEFLIKDDTSYIGNLKIVLRLYENCDCEILKDISEKYHISDLKIVNLNTDSILCDISMFQSLLNLDISNNNLKRIPRNLNKLKQIESIDFSDNPELKINEILNIVFNIHSLKFLQVCNNNIEMLPEEVDKSSDIELIDLSNNKLTYLPNWILRLPKLKVLILVDNKFRNKVKADEIKIDFYGNPCTRNSSER